MSDTRLVGRERWKNIRVTFARREALASPSLRRLLHLMDTGTVGRSSRRILLHFPPSSFILLPICHLSPSHRLQCHLTSISPLPMLCLCRPLLNQMDCKCVISQWEENLLPPIFQFAVIYPPHSLQESMHKLFRRTRPYGNSIYHKPPIWALILICD